jgi:hypothetical protein
MTPAPITPIVLAGMHVHSIFADYASPVRISQGILMRRIHSSLQRNDGGLGRRVSRGHLVQQSTELSLLLLARVVSLRRLFVS